MTRKKAGLDRAEVDAYVAGAAGTGTVVVDDPAEPGRWSRDPDDDYLVGLVTLRTFLDRLEAARERMPVRHPPTPALDRTSVAESSRLGEDVDTQVPLTQGVTPVRLG